MAEPDTPVRAYVAVYILLIILLALTTGLAFVDLAPLGALVALVIAATKAVLVILYFMKARTAPRVTQVFVVVGFYWLALLFGGSMGDLLTRSWLSPILGGAP
jgi:cytochrome c oxidase subunit 4